MKTTLQLFLCLVVLILIIHPVSLQAQSARSLYFMDNAPARMNLNPALQPMRGYFNFPVIGGIGATVVSDPLSVNDFMDILDEDNDFLNNDKLYDKLKNMNHVSMDLSMDIISLGFYSGKGFWTINIGTKVLLSTSIPKTMFEFARDADDIIAQINDATSGHGEGINQERVDELLQTRFEVKDLQITADAFAEFGLGYSRPVNDRLTIGGKIKVLVGMGNLDAHVHEMTMEVEDYKWRVKTRGNLDVSMKGLDLSTQEGGGYIDDFDIDSPGIGGFGGGIDLGASYNIWKNLTLSASILDLGFINWSKSATTTATTNKEHLYDPAAMEDGSEIFNLDLIQFKAEEASKKRTTSLRPMLNVGAEYTFLRKKIGIGMLYSNRFQKPENFSELTFSANFRPKNWFGATLSYSFLHSDLKTFGLGLKFGPIYLATDYMITGDFKSINRANAYLGVSFGLGKKKNEAANKS